MRHTAPITPLDRWIEAADTALKTVTTAFHAQRQAPREAATDSSNLSTEEQRHSAGLMRVNQVGEVCAQALYSAQSTFARGADLRRDMTQAALEERDHLAWTTDRIAQLGSRPSLLNPLWYAGAFGIGSLAALAGDRWSLGFVMATEQQVTAHLDRHLDELPVDDSPSRAIVKQMRKDEAHHAQAAADNGALPLPPVFEQAMHLVARVMTTTAYRI